ncbi:MAG TPA: FliA/WhiG family RNA polymerase sigma factor [Pirellulaceae bacterium]|nr:FliA/WhiG family RNA polymerase sigma factor [Pirellulaceae bacterium]HMO93737.1 FliA/WhiG family RNA polymerase sigma factor [Pirellulaceae bacterium]HMP69927.1 FliA/WhiG family RNA polymerase sigma factor [Pirellulaceae bacterium]
MNTALRAYRQASENQTELLILENIGFVRKILSTMTVGLPEHCDRENLEQAGMVGLVEAAKSYDPTREVQFRTFAFNRIRGAIIDEMRKNSALPQKVMEQISQVRQAYEKLEGPVTPEMLAAHTGMSLAKVAQTLEAMRFVQPQSWNDLHTQIQAIRESVDESPDAELETTELKKRVADCIEKLPDRERLVLTLYFNEDLTLAEIGQVIGLSESRVSRVLASAKFRLKEMVAHGNE